MRLAIVNLTGGGLSGGYKKYLKNLLPRFAEHRDLDALLCISSEGNDIPSWFKKPPAADFCSCSPLSLGYLAYLPDRKMTDCLKKFSPDVVFLPVDRYIRFDGIPVVNMVRNMEPFIPGMKGDTLPERFKKLIQRKLAINAVQRANRTIAVSRFVKDFLTMNLRIPEARVSQVYHGLTSQPVGEGRRPGTIPNGWDGQFLFTCGSIRPARGLEDTLEALGDLKARNIDMRLVIAGETVPSMRTYRNGLERLIVLRGLRDCVCWTGNLNEDEMSWCYDNCKLFIMTSRVEACPNIVLEALDHGSVAISTDALPMPEFFQDSAVYYSNGNGSSLSSAICETLGWDAERRRELSQRAKERASQFSWDRCAEETVRELKKTVSPFPFQNSKGE